MEVCKLLLKHIRSSPLTTAIANDNHTEVDALIVASEDINVFDANGFTPLLLATLYGAEEIVATLLDSGTDPNRAFIEQTEVDAPPIPGRYFGTPMSAAAMNDDVSLMILLHEYGASIEKAGWRGITPLISALLFGKVPSVEYLLNQGVNPKSQDVENYIPQAPQDETIRDRFMLLLDAH